MRHGPIENVVECFEDVEDPRVEGRGADNWVEVEQYGQAKERIAGKLA